VSKIITITGYKGGVSKSTTAVHLADYLSDKGTTVLVDGDPNRTSIKWAESGKLRFAVADERQAMKHVRNADYLVIDTPARPDSSDLKELAAGCDLLILPTAPDVLSLQPMLETARDLEDANYRALVSIVPPHPSKEGEIMRLDLEEGGIPVFKTMIRRTVGFPKSALEGVTVRDISESKFRVAWNDYQRLGDEVMQILEGLDL